MLEFFKWLIIILMSGCVLWLFIHLLKNKQPIKTLFLSGLCGVISLFIVIIIGFAIGDILEINLCTLSISSILGIPGVILMILVKMFWMI